jgi:membrane-associated phospholipid phosphatase
VRSHCGSREPGKSQPSREEERRPMVKAGEPDHQGMIKKYVVISLPVVTLVCIGGFYGLDVMLAYYCKSLNSHILDLFEFITKFGMASWYLVPSLAAFLIFELLYKKKLWSIRALFVFASIAFSGILVDILKFIFGRYRPIMLFDYGLYGFSFFKTSSDLTSFPSGHASNITALIISLYFIYPKYRNIYIIVAVLVIISRMILGLHFFTDVLAGSYLATITTLIVKSYFDSRFPFSPHNGVKCKQ